MGCGTGAHLRHLVGSFGCTGLDLSEEMLEVAREEVPGVELARGDMHDFHLGRVFDVVICMFSIIGYARTRDDLERAIGRMAHHLVEGGVLIIEPWVQRDDFRPGRVGINTYDGEDAKIARVTSSWVEGDLAVPDMHYLIGEPGEGVRHYVDRHELRLFDLDEAVGVMEAVGLETSFDEEGFGQGRGALIGVKKQA